uniref:Uncharacterized protein n=1 Tax=Cannabis sativa TaxID=3483 RepID=A0A803PKC3_CANSA
MGRRSRVCQYMENHLDEERLVAPEQDLPLSAIGDREANIDRAQADEEHQQRVPIGVPNAPKDVKTVMRGPCLGGEARRKRDRYALEASGFSVSLQYFVGKAIANPVENGHLNVPLDHEISNPRGCRHIEKGSG